MPVIHSLDDPRLAPYRNLKDHELEGKDGRFIAEGEQVVRRLLASVIPTESVLLSTRKADRIGPLVPPQVPVWIAGDELIAGLIGFEFHSGVLAVGLRPDPGNLSTIIGSASATKTLAICPNIANTRNLGSLIRVCAAFGVDGLLLGESCCDPYFRQSVRISMGTIFSLPIARSPDITADLTELRERMGFDLVASVASSDAEPLARALRGLRLGILFGNEASGLAPEHVAGARRVTIPMRRGTDSLNVAVAAGIFLHHFIDLWEIDQAVRSSPDSSDSSSGGGV